jgi:flagellar biosynthesis GTPase FlhF
MTIKSFFADTVAAAMREARAQLGEEAMLLKSRRAPEESRHLGVYEVVFGVVQAPGEHAAGSEVTLATVAAASVAPSNGASSNGTPSNGLAAHGTGANGNGANRNGANGAGSHGNSANGNSANGKGANGHGIGAARPAASESIWDVPYAAAASHPCTAAFDRTRADALYRKLLELEFDETLAADFAEHVQARLLAESFDAGGSNGALAAPGEATARAILLEAERFFERETALNDADGGVAALIGPPGGGKTSTIVRLAVGYGLAQSRRVILLAADDHRVAAAAMLQHYAALLGVECHAGCGSEELAARVERRKPGELILIDTPGFGAREIEQARPLANYLARRLEIQKHLVLPATLKADDLRAAVDRFEIFATDRLLFTRLDETERFGPAFSEAAASGKAVSFLTTGQQVPGDISAASQFQLAPLLSAREGAMASAA